MIITYNDKNKGQPQSYEYLDKQRQKCYLIPDAASTIRGENSSRAVLLCSIERRQRHFRLGDSV